MSEYNQLTGLLNIIIGSGKSVSRLRDSKAKTTSGINNAKFQAVVSTIQEDIRKSIEANLPVFYLLNAKIIVDSMLEALHPDNGKKIEKYLSYMREDDGTVYDFSKIQGSVLEVKNAFGTVEKTVTTGGFTDLYLERYNTLLEEKENLVQDIILALRADISSTVTMIELSNFIANLNNTLAKKLTALSLLPEEFESRARNEATKHIRAIGSLIRRKFKSVGTSVITDADFFLTTYDRYSQLLVVGSSYSNLVTYIHNIITKVLRKYVEKLKITVNNTEFKAGNFAAAGHTGLRSGSSIIGINTPLTQIAAMILANNNIDAPGIMEGFIANTGHGTLSIDVNENYIDSSKMALGIGISFLQSMPSVYNSESLSPEETSYFKKIFKERFDKDYLVLRRELTNALKNPKIFNYIFKVFKLSPSLEEALLSHIAETLSGKTFKGPAKTKKATVSGVDELIRIKGSKLKSVKVQGNKPKNTTIKPMPIRNNMGRFTSLASLQNLLNRTLAEQIRKNMGDGSRTNILNYRTGRFANSVSVEHMSQSREGMITAFYTYMKYPYATFSEGGLQSSPKTRDPKLLISRSIREIGAKVVANRMRAVLT